MQIRAGVTTPPLYCVHAQAGHLRLFANLAPHLDPDRPVFGLRAVARDDAGLSPYRRLEDMAERYASEIRAKQPERSLLHPGGVQRRAAGPRARAAAVRDRRAGAVTCTGGQLWTGRATPSLVRTKARSPLSRHRPDARVPSPDGRRLDISAKKAYVSERLVRLLLQRRKRAAARRGAPSPELMRQQGFGEALAAYQPEQYPGRVVLFRGAGLQWGLARTNDFGWGAVAADLEVVKLPAYVGTTMLEPAVRLLAERLVEALDASTSMTELS